MKYVKKNNTQNNLERMDVSYAEYDLKKILRLKSLPEARSDKEKCTKVLYGSDKLYMILNNRKRDTHEKLYNCTIFFILSKKRTILEKAKYRKKSFIKILTDNMLRKTSIILRIKDIKLSNIKDNDNKLYREVIGDKRAFVGISNTICFRDISALLILEIWFVNLYIFYSIVGVIIQNVTKWIKVKKKTLEKSLARSKHDHVAYNKNKSYVRCYRATTTVSTRTLLTTMTSVILVKRFVHEGPVIKKVVEKCIGPGCKELTNNASKLTNRKEPASTTQHTDINKNEKPKVSPISQDTSSKKEISSIPEKIKQPHKWISSTSKDNNNTEATNFIPSEHTKDTSNSVPEQTKSTLSSKIKDNALLDSIQLIRDNNIVSVKDNNTTSSYDHMPLVQDSVGLTKVPMDPTVPDVNIASIPELNVTLGIDDNGNFFTIPSPPSLPPKTHIPLPSKMKGNILDEILGLKPKEETSNIKPSEVKQKLKQLEYRGLLTYENEQEKLTKEFYNLPKDPTKNAETIEVDITDDIIKNNYFHIGILQVTDIHNSILLNGIQTHVVVIYTVQDDKKIVIGYLTSKKKSTILLSETQPFDFDNKHKNKQQYLTVLEEPLVIVQDHYIKELQSIQIAGEIINQQKVGEDYINQPFRKEIIQKQLIKKVLPFIRQQGNSLQEYNGEGLTLEDIDYAIKTFDEQAEQKAQKFFSKYKQDKKQGKIKSVDDWLENTAKTSDKITLEVLKNKIDEHENK